MIAPIGELRQLEAAPPCTLDLGFIYSLIEVYDDCSFSIIYIIKVLPEENVVDLFAYKGSEAKELPVNTM